MSTTGNNRLTEIYDHFKETNSEMKTAVKFGLRLDTVSRYLRAKREIERTDSNEFEKPKILLFDIETTPMEVYVWGLYKQRIQHTNVIKDWCVLSWAAKWIFDNEIQSDVLTAKQAQNRDDSSIIKGIWDLMDEADIVIAHNGNRFDIRKLNARFQMNRLLQPSPYQSIDTLKVSQRMFAFSSHKLDYLGQILLNKGKIETNYQLWKDCVENNSKTKEALEYMIKYNRGDVNLLEEVYLELRHWIKSHPNMGLYNLDNVSQCPACGSTSINWNGKSYYTPAGRFSAFQCNSCGAWGRSRFTELSLDKRKELTLSNAR